MGRKQSEAESFYSSAENAELYHISKHMIKNHNDIKTLDVKILELREQPDDLDLLYSIMAMIYEEKDHRIEVGEAEIKDHDLVNYVLANALKADKIPAEELGLVLAYLECVSAPAIYWQYAILRVH